MTAPIPVVEPQQGDPSHFLPSEVVGPGRKYNSHSKPYSALGYKIKALNAMIDSLETVEVRGKRDGAFVTRLVGLMLAEADADGTEPAVRQKILACVADTYCRLQETTAKLAVDSIDLETKRSDTRLKRQMWRDKQGIKGTVNTTAEPAGLSEVADLMRRSQEKP